MNIAVTGASGYLGSRLLHFLKSQGHCVYSFVRNPKKIDEIEFSLADISGISDIFSQLKLDILIHCAWDLSISNYKKSYEYNVLNSISLFRVAKKDFNLKIIFISSMSAFDGCNSIYGKQKLEVENEVLDMCGIVLRPGLIWGENCTGGMFLTLNNLVKKLPCIPMIGSGADRLYLSHVDDLSDLVCKIALTYDSLKPCIITAASCQPVTFKKILQICAGSVGNRPALIPIPHKIILWPIKILEYLKIPLPIRSDSVVGLIHSDRNPNFDQSKLTKIGFLGFRNFNNSSVEI